MSCENNPDWYRISFRHMQENLGHFKLQILNFHNCHGKHFFGISDIFFVTHSLIYFYIYLRLKSIVYNLSHFYIVFFTEAKAKQTFTPSYSVIITELSHLAGFSLMFYLANSSLSFC